jgi:adenine-specific DNA-methyltransferase
MAGIEVTKTELVWPGKYSEGGTVKEVPHVSLPFQVIETVNESRATREAQKHAVQGTLFDVWEGKEGDTFEAGWSNKLIWGDNLLVMASLLEKFAGKIDLVYIDPPFATGADFSFRTEVGDGAADVFKEQSLIEEKAYRDTWGRSPDSYLEMLTPRLVLIRELLSSRGSAYVHIGPQINHLVRCLLDEVFGGTNSRREIIWKRVSARGHGNYYPATHDAILFYSKTDELTWNQLYEPLDAEYVADKYRFSDPGGRRYRKDNCLNQNPDRPNLTYDWKGHVRTWRWTKEKMQELDKAGRLIYTKSGLPEYKRYLDESLGTPLQSIWTDIPPVNSQADEDTGYDTQKPEGLLDRIIRASSNPGDLVADFFCGSGTALAVAEKLGRRWIGCDLGRWGMHVSRKRLLGIEKCKPFHVLNLGRYERQYWQGATFGYAKGTAVVEQALYEYLAFVLKLYGAQPLAGMVHLHGKKGRAMIHIGAVDAPVTIAEIDAALDECVKLRQRDLHVLGWEWEMGLYDLMVEAAKKKSVKLSLFQIPREVMEQQATAKGDVHFFELAYLEADIKHTKKLTTRVTLSDFVIPNTELIQEDVRSKVKKWSDYIDYWAVDWNFQNDTFMQGWVTYRTRRERKLPLISDPHTYGKPGNYRILVKVIDIFGNDTSQAFDVEVK